MYAIVDAWWTSSAGHGRAIEITRAERERGDTSPVKRLADAIRLAGVMVTGVLSRRTVRPRGDEARRPLPGDELVASAKIRWTHGITIRARPGEIWPWLRQMGCRRGGWYSYDGLDNGGVASADRMVP